ncbi:hypothetical protein [Mangrovivirga cuniculi]|uniref:Uncharacterized protein n=1 Tax=Mangrovivirga cuniculi TaxID=2715131 RepID=A0A4D7K7R2_9BACT|nr:hypothetical protein [Mangrovivirga cuniculi]QCK16774.1 hypothetical protein DCC35_19575 [Mangrovivirga cuniculi]
MRSIIFLFICSFFTISGQSVSQLYQQAVNSRESGNYDEYLGFMKEANALRANNQRIMYSLAEAYAYTGKADSAFYFLKEVLKIDAENYSLENDAFNTLKSGGFLQRLKFYKNLMQTQIISSDTMLVIEDPDFHIEDIQNYPSINKILVSSVNHRMIYEVDDEGKIKPVLPGKLKLSPLGIDLDNNGSLWVASVGISQGKPNKDFIDRSIIYKIDLQKGVIVKEIEISGESFAGDLFISRDQNVYVTDSKNNSLLKLEGDVFVPVLSDDRFVSLQGITELNGKIYLSDYVKGIFRWDPVSSELIKIRSSKEITLKGIDGLYSYKNKLIGIQNGVRPFRILELELDDGGEFTVNHNYLEKAHPAMDEPTLGFIEGDKFYYLANSFWQLNQDGVINNPENKLPVILTTELNDSKYNLVVEEQVEILNNRAEEAHYFYLNNWAEFRKAARFRGLVSDYSISTTNDSLKKILLRTVYPDSSSYFMIEEFFKSWSGTQDGPQFLNEVPPSEFRKVLQSIIAVEKVSQKFSEEKLSPLCRTEDHRAFDFWLGKWSVYNKNGKFLGYNNVELIQNGCVIKENWFSGNAILTGTSMNFYNKSINRWQQSWVDNTGGVLQLTGGIDDDQMILRSDTTQENQHRITWRPSQDGTVEQIWESTEDGGSTWKQLFYGIYKNSESESYERNKTQLIQEESN